MCHDYLALPPAIPAEVLQTLSFSASQPAPSGQRLELISADGTHFAAYRARPTTPNGAGIVILPDVRGLFRFYEDLAERFAQVGVEAIVIDYFGRTAGLAPRDESFDFMDHIKQTKADQIAQDVAAAVANLHQTAGAHLQAVFTVGFCFGGWSSLQQAANGHRLAGAIAFYGSPTSPRLGVPAAIERVQEIACPILGLYGGADTGIPTADLDRFDAALTAHGVAHAIIVYPDAPHSFFDRSADQHQAAAADSWRQVLAFITANTPQGTI